MMKRLVANVREAIRQELELASKDYGKHFASDHEAYAVIKEELEEAITEMDGAKQHLERFWEQVKANGTMEEKLETLGALRNYCGRCAAEMIQTAAMAEKSTRMPLKRDDEKRG